MRTAFPQPRLAVSGLALAWLLVAAGPASRAQAEDAAATTQTPAPKEEAKVRMELYGAVMLDMGYQSKQNDPNWFDVVRPSKLPAFENQFGADGRFFAGVRQSRIGTKAFIPTSKGEIKTTFEWELFGTGVDAGQTTFRLRHAWGEMGQFGAGQTNSPFMDGEVFPNSIEYWGPNGMVYFANVQLRWTPWTSGDSNFMIALERPGASADQGVYAGRIALQGVTGRFPLPDLSAHYKQAGKWGYVQLAGIVRKMKWDDLNADPFDLSGEATGWGLNLSSTLKIGKKCVPKLAVVYGEGIENYMNDAPVDVGVQNNFQDRVRPVIGKALPIFGLLAFLDLNWSARWTSTLGYSMADIDNSDAQAANAFKKGQYALANLLYYPTPDLFLGPEIQWAKRENFRDGFSSDDLRLQFSV